MRQILVTLLLLWGFVQMNYAKTTYLASYHAAIYFTNGDQTDSLTTITPELSYDLYGGAVSITILQDLMDKSRIKSIKRMKAAAGWSAVASASSAVSAGLDRHPISYYNDMETSKMAAVVSADASRQAADLQSLPISLFVENNSDKEIYINLTFTGLVYYIRPHSVLSFPVSNPIVTELRVAYAYPEQPEPEYITIAAYNESKKWELDWEDDQYSCVHNYVDNNYKLPMYYLLNKDTYEFGMVYENVQKGMKEERKDSIKAFKKAQEEAEEKVK